MRPPLVVPASRPTLGPVVSSGERAVFSQTSFILTLVGATTCTVGFFGPPWVRSNTSGNDGGPTFTEVGSALRIAELFTHRTLALTAYFTWLGFVLAGLAFMFAVIASLPTGSETVFRTLGALTGFVSALAALFAPLLDGANPFGNYLTHGFGLYLVFGGSLTMAIAAALGPSRVAINSSQIAVRA